MLRDQARKKVSNSWCRGCGCTQPSPPLSHLGFCPLISEPGTPGGITRVSPAQRPPFLRSTGLGRKIAHGTRLLPKHRTELAMSQLDPSCRWAQLDAVKLGVCRGRKALHLNCTCFGKVFLHRLGVCLTQLPRVCPRLCAAPNCQERPWTSRWATPAHTLPPAPQGHGPSMSWLRGTWGRAGRRPFLPHRYATLGKNMGEDAFSSVKEGTG